MRRTIIDTENEDEGDLALDTDSEPEHPPSTKRALEVSVPVESKKFRSLSATYSSPSSKASTQTVEAFQNALKGAQGPPIRVINQIDDAGLPKDFRYIDECIFAPGIPIPDKDFLVGCDCFGCDRSDYCVCTENNNGTMPYTPEGLLADFSKKSAIFECNERCFCGPGCPSRVVQKGRKIRMDIVRISEAKGWGVITREPIPKGSFAAQYTGEIITNVEATKRTKKYGPERMYLFDLDYNYDSGCECEFTIDAIKHGNISHFFNHSCEPNLQVRAVLINNLDPRMHLVAFFASRDIRVGEELTFDYMGQRDGVTHESHRSVTNAVLKRPKIKCLCGTKSCRKYVYL